MKNSREIRQLWFAAQDYIRVGELILAKNVSHSNKTFGNFAEYFSGSKKIKADIIESNFGVAHLSSFSTRIQTIDERFREDHGHPIVKGYSGKIDKSKSVAQIERELEPLIKEHFHQLLRDNVGHIERGKKTVKQIFLNLTQARQNVIERAKIKDGLQILLAINKKYEGELKSKGII